jgi:hypothetical protein
MSSTTAPTPISASGGGVGDRDGLVRQTGGQDVPDAATHLLCRADAIERSLRLVDVDEPKVPVHHRQPDPGRGVHFDPHAPGPRAVPLSHGSPRASVLLDIAARQVDTYAAATSRYAPFIPPHRAQA